VCSGGYPGAHGAGAGMGGMGMGDLGGMGGLGSLFQDPELLQAFQVFRTKSLAISEL